MLELPNGYLARFFHLIINIYVRFALIINHSLVSSVLILSHILSAKYCGVTEGSVFPFFNVTFCITWVPRFPGSLPLQNDTLRNCYCNGRLQT